MGVMCPFVAVRPRNEWVAVGARKEVCGLDGRIEASSHEVLLVLGKTVRFPYFDGAENFAIEVGYPRYLVQQSLSFGRRDLAIHVCIDSQHQEGVEAKQE